MKKQIAKIKKIELPQDPEIFQTQRDVWILAKKINEIIERLNETK